MVDADGCHSLLDKGVTVVVATRMLDWLLGFSDKRLSPSGAKIDIACSPRAGRISLAQANPLYEVFFPA